MIDNRPIAGITSITEREAEQRALAALHRVRQQNRQVFDLLASFLADLPASGEVTLTIRHGKLHGIREVRATYGD